MLDFLHGWWDEQDIGETLRDMLYTVVNEQFCHVKLSMVKYATCDRVFFNVGVIANHRFAYTKSS